MTEVTKELLDQIHEIMYKILCDIDDYCRKNQITYYLSGGTCLGAVRHHGFIPWDDDSDIMMPRRDYERFISHFAGTYPLKYGFRSLQTDALWNKPFARVWDLNTELINTKRNELSTGIGVDIFPIDGLPDQKWKQKLLYARIRILNWLKNCASRKEIGSDEKHRFLKRIIDPLVKTFAGNSVFWAQCMDNAAKKYDFNSSKYVAVTIVVHYGERETLMREDEQRPVYMKFEGRDFPVPNGYKKYLSNLYGDYMKEPTDQAQKIARHLKDADIRIGNGKRYS